MSERQDTTGIFRILYDGHFPLSVTSSTHGLGLYLQSVLVYSQDMTRGILPESLQRDRARDWIDQKLVLKSDDTPNLDFGESSPDINAQNAEYGVFIRPEKREILTRSLNGDHMRILGTPIRTLETNFGYTHRHETHEQATERIKRRNDRLRERRERRRKVKV